MLRVQGLVLRRMNVKVGRTEESVGILLEMHNLSLIVRKRLTNKMRNFHLKEKMVAAGERNLSSLKTPMS